MRQILCRPARFAVATLLAIGIGACGDSATSPLTRIAGVVAGQLTASPADARAALSPQVVAAVEQPFVLVTLPARQASATMTAFAFVDGRTDWRGGDGISLVMVQDILIATRGLGSDLFLAQNDGLLPAIAIRSGAHVRYHSVLDGENREAVSVYDCAVTVGPLETVDLIDRAIAAETVVETCNSRVNGVDGFTNTYWIGVDDGFMWQSRQWVSPQTGYVEILHIKR